MIQQKKILFGSVLVLVILGLAVFLGMCHNGAVSPETLTETQQGSSTGAITSEVANANTDEVASSEKDAKPRRPTLDELEMRDSEIVRLYQFLDDNDTEAILAQAEFLSMSEDPVRRNSVVGALKWVNNARAARILIPLLSDSDSAIASEARDAIGHIINTFQTEITRDSSTGEFETDDDVDLNEVYEVSKEALLAAPDEDSLDMLMLDVTTMDAQIALPLLLEVLENGADWQKPIAQEYIDFVTQGDDVTNREQAVLWLQKDAGLVEDVDTTDSDDVEDVDVE